MLRIIISILILFCCSCSQRYSYDKSSLNEATKIKEIENVLAARQQQALLYDIDSKYTILLDRFNSQFLLSPRNIVVREYFTNRDVQTSVIDETVFYLIYLSQLSMVFDNDDLEQLIYNIVVDIIEIDKLNGLDGYLPRSVSFDKDLNQLVIVPDEIHSNSYSIIMLGYYMAYNSSKSMKVRDLISGHVSMIAKYYLDNDLVLRDDKGNEVRVSNLNKRHLSRELDALVIFEIGKKLTKDPKLQLKFEAIVDELKAKGYNKKHKILHLTLLNFEIPSHSSNWLNMLRLYILAKATDEKIYENHFVKLYNILEDEHNPFFDVLYMDLFNQLDEVKMQRISFYLQSFPIELDNREIISSYDADVDLALFPRITKNYIEAESVEALPIYRRPLKYFEWKENQRRIDGNWEGKGNILFSGLDYLLLYSMYKKLNHNSAQDENF
ncbi:MAG: hypothetical protein HOM96_03630 [Rickettsiales bacterium]|jgi:hypothetical protein|nr:hypothetical protein [Rickettsiales bacterium]